MLPAMFAGYVGTSTDMKKLWTILFLCPIWFSTAHLHHFFDKLRNGSLLTNAIIVTLFQATYTSIFGFIAVILFARTGNIISPIVSHIVCNLIGLPDFGFMFMRNTNVSLSTLEKRYQSQNCSEYSFMYEFRYLLLTVHAGGLILFAMLLFPLTESFIASSLYWQQFLK